MKISVICLGKIKENYLRMMIEDYQKKLRKYCKLEIIEIKEESIFNENKADVDKVLEEEEKRIIGKFNPKALKICLAIEGKQYSSEDFAQYIENTAISNSHIQFVIGSSYGLSENVKSKCDGKISFSKTTFTHQVIRPILLEQIYRAFKINNNEKYHK